MKYNEDKVDDMVLALLFLTSTTDSFATRAWKGLDWAAMERLHQKGLISDPKTKALSVVLTPEGARLSKELFYQFFEVDE